MKTISLVACVVITIIGVSKLLFTPADVLAWSILITVTSLAALVISLPTSKVGGYDPKQFMNR